MEPVIETLVIETLVIETPMIETLVIVGVEVDEPDWLVPVEEPVNERPGKLIGGR